VVSKGLLSIERFVNAVGEAFFSVENVDVLNAMVQKQKRG